MRSKTIYLLSDGTGNSAASSHRSNVWRFYQALKLGQDSDQLAFYDDGVGTSKFPLARALGGAFGIGLSRNLQELYAALCLHYRPGDRIAMVGFSRGAYTVRLLAALICKLGIVPLADNDDMHAAENAAPDKWAHLPQDRAGRARTIARAAWRTYRYRSHWREEDRPAGEFPKGPLISLVFHRHTQARFHERYLAAAADAYQAPEICFLGVWDTVAAYGLPIDELAVAVNRLVTPLRFGDHDLNPRVLCARHALALDEARQTFKPLIWNELSTQRHPNVKQVWFAGVHADLGGGYPDDALANQALDWMIKECTQAAIDQGYKARFKDSALSTIRDIARYDGPMHNSRQGVAALYRYKPRNIHALCRQEVHDSVDLVTVKTDDVIIHQSAVNRFRSNHDGYAPAALAKPWGHPDEKQLPLRIDSLGQTARTGDLYQSITVQTDACQRIQENTVLRQISHNISIVALTILVVCAGIILVDQWGTCSPDHAYMPECIGIILSGLAFSASQAWSVQLDRRGQILADFMFAPTRTEVDRVASAAAKGLFKQSRGERVATTLLRIAPARKHYVRFVNFWLPWILVPGMAFLLGWLLYRGASTACGAFESITASWCLAARCF